MQASNTVAILAALSNEHRLAMVDMLRDGELCLCEIAPRFDLDQSVVSRHLTTLERAGVVLSRRDGRRTLYRLADRRVLRLTATAATLASRTGGPGRQR